MMGIYRDLAVTRSLKVQMEKGKTKVFMVKSTYIRDEQYTNLHEAACKCPWKACHGWKSRPRNYSGFLIYYLNSYVRESGNFCLWNPESRKKIPEESRILGFGIRNPTDDWNAESKSHWQKIRNPVPGVRNLCLGTVLDYLTRGDQQTRRYVHTRTHVCSVKLY